MEILRLMAILLLIILVIVIGAKVVYKDNLVVLTGTITLTLNNEKLTGSQNINYPTGFNKDNCIPIAIGISGSTSGDTQYSFDFSGDTAASYVSGGIARNLRLKDDVMSLDVYSSAGASSNTRNYKIVLMKID